MELRSKKVLVVGLGRTGEALCDFLLKKGAKVKISEKKKKEELTPALNFWISQGVKVETNGHQQKSFMEADLIIPSPGVPLLPELKAAQEKGIKVISEVELASNYLKGKVVGITGSNGKSTTATLTHNILKNGGLESFLAGNIGLPLIEMVEKSKNNHIYVTELSSFQLQYVQRFKPFISVFLNISPDHLDWHPSFDQYFQAKKNLFSNLHRENIAILNRDDPLVWSLSNQNKFKVFGFSQNHKVNPGCYTQQEWVIISHRKEEKLIKTSEVPLRGKHNLENIMAASLVGYLFGVSLPNIHNSIHKFKGLEHRLKKVTTIQNIDFYDDSKATNIQAALQSINSFSKGIILILGGRDKGGDFKQLKPVIQEKVKRIIVIGEAQKKIEQALKGIVPLVKASSLGEAVKLGYKSGQEGDVVLLAPACTSFDMFQNFEHRGEVFKREVKTLAKKIKH